MQNASPSNLNGLTIEQLKAVKFAKLKDAAGRGKNIVMNDNSSRPQGRVRSILEKFEGLSLDDISKTINALCSTDNRTVQDRTGNDLFDGRTNVGRALGDDADSARSKECLDILLLLKYKKEQEKKAEFKADLERRGIAVESERGDE